MTCCVYVNHLCELLIYQKLNSCTSDPMVSDMKEKIDRKASQFNISH